MPSNSIAIENLPQIYCAEVSVQSAVRTAECLDVFTGS